MSLVVKRSARAREFLQRRRLSITTIDARGGSRVHQDEEKRRVVVRAIVVAFIEHPNWRNSQIARETGFDVGLVEEVRAFALSFPPIEGVKPEPKDDTDE